MKKLLIFVLIVWFTPSFSQANKQEINEKRAIINKNGMKVLGGWALANLTIGGIGYFQSSGRNKYFHQMNAMWGVVNLGIATAGYFGAKADMKEQLNFAQSINDQKKIEQILILNAGLDAAYMVTGLYLNERGLRKSSDRLRGYGKSLLLQGAFLLVFDGAMFAIHKNNGKGLDKLMDKMNFNFDGKQISLAMRLK